MMHYYVVDAFTDVLFRGNPAGVCLPDKPIDAALMQRIAFENNLAETAFLFEQNGYYDLRWFTPQTEIDLCGHATLASAFVLLTTRHKRWKSIEFSTKSGRLFVERSGPLYTLDFPSRAPKACEMPCGLEQALGVRVLETHQARDLVAVVESEDVLSSMRPDFTQLKKIEGYFAVIATAQSSRFDFVSRFFAPRAGIDEDPVTGSSHCTLIPFWSRRLDKKQMVAAQLSQRGGVIYCGDDGERVKIGGKAVLYLTGQINL